MKVFLSMVVTVQVSQGFFEKSCQICSLFRILYDFSNIELLINISMNLSVSKMVNLVIQRNIFLSITL